MPAQPGRIGRFSMTWMRPMTAPRMPMVGIAAADSQIFAASFSSAPRRRRSPLPERPSSLPARRRPQQFATARGKRIIHFPDLWPPAPANLPDVRATWAPPRSATTASGMIRGGKNTTGPSVCQAGKSPGLCSITCAQRAADDNEKRRGLDQGADVPAFDGWPMTIAVIPASRPTTLILSIRGPPSGRAFGLRLAASHRCRGADLHRRAQTRDRLAMQLANPRLGDAKDAANLAEIEVVIVIERHDQTFFPLRQRFDAAGPERGFMLAGPRGQRRRSSAGEATLRSRNRPPDHPIDPRG